ncbi:MAG: serine hydrolase [Bacteroidota bacterium]
MKSIVFIVLLAFTSTLAYGQGLDTAKLDQLFDALEKRNEAMGSLVIARNGIILYSRAIGMRSIDADTSIAADIKTNYRIWSITKPYTATMILQLAEEGKLTLDTTLDTFYPGIPNAGIITIRQMLQHKSGIHDFIQNDTNEDWDTYIHEPLTPDFMVPHISQYPPDFQPGTAFGYSNSNYLLLGYIIEQLDGHTYGQSLYSRISERAGLTSTYFGVGALDQVENKAQSYAHNGQWQPIDEGPFSGLIPAGAGGIVSTPTDMALFIDALFTGKLVSDTSLALMLPKDDNFYKLGLMRFPHAAFTGYGHTGGYVATESSLAYYPQDSLIIAYATNGIVLRKEDILSNVLKIYHGEPFAVSMNRDVQTALVFAFGLLLFACIKTHIRPQQWRWTGLGILLLFWAGTAIAGQLLGAHSHVQDAVTDLAAFYSASGTFMASIELVIALTLLFFLHACYAACKREGLSILPLLPALFIPISLLGATLFSFPNPLYTLFANLIILSAFSPLLALIFWRTQKGAGIRWAAAASLLLMVLSLGLIFSRPSFPAFVHAYWGLIQRSLYLGWTVWIAALGLLMPLKPTTP